MFGLRTDGSRGETPSPVFHRCRDKRVNGSTLTVTAYRTWTYAALRRACAGVMKALRPEWCRNRFQSARPGLTVRDPAITARTTQSRSGSTELSSSGRERDRRSVLAILATWRLSGGISARARSRASTLPRSRHVARSIRTTRVEGGAVCRGRSHPRRRSASLAQIQSGEGRQRSAE